MDALNISPRDVEEFEEDSRWFYNNLRLLRSKYTGNFVAIKNKNVIATDKDLLNLIKAIEEKGENPAYIIIEFVYPEEAVILL